MWRSVASSYQRYWVMQTRHQRVPKLGSGLRQVWARPEGLSVWLKTTERGRARKISSSLWERLAHVAYCEGQDMEAVLKVLRTYREPLIADKELKQ